MAIEANHVEEAKQAEERGDWPAAVKAWKLAVLDCKVRTMRKQYFHSLRCAREKQWREDLTGVKVNA